MSEQKNYHPNRPQGPPHKTLGKYLKTLRQKYQETLGETSGAVEIKVEDLDQFERGAELPSEDILLLLISHFSLQDDEAVELWDLAGYDHDADSASFSGSRATKPENSDRAHDRTSHQSPTSQHDEGQQRQAIQAIPVMLLALDSRVIYSNGVEVVSDDVGMILNFMQSAPTTRPSSPEEVSQHHYPVSRVGMSHDQAEQLVQVIQRALLHKKYLSGPKQLPPPKT